MNTFTYTLRVQSEYTDYNGIVHHANYLKFMEAARVEWAYSFGARLDEMIRDGIGFVVRRAELEFFKPARFYDELAVITSVVKMRRVSKLCEQIVCNANDHSHIYCRGLILVACVDTNLKPRALPQSIVDGMG